jgi:hypothetical protein
MVRIKKAIERLKLVAHVLYVDHDEDGYWVALKESAKWDSESMIHEDTESAVIDCLKMVEVVK